MKELRNSALVSSGNKELVGLRLPRMSKVVEQFSAYMFLLPAILLFTAFAWYPMINSLLMSFQNVKLAGESDWVGLDNYARMLSDSTFGESWNNSLQFAIISIIMGFLIPIIVAVAVNEMRRFKGFFRLVFFLPSLIPVVIYLLVWRLIYAPEGGFLNSLLTSVGLEPQLWLQDAGLVKPSLIVILTWANFGSTMLIYLASLQDLSTELYEAAEIDGASPTQRIWHITVPYLLSTVKLLLVLQFLTVVQLFTEPFLLTAGGPANNTLTPVLSIYRKAFVNNDYGVAAAWSVVLVIFLAIFSVIYQKVAKSTSESA